MSNYNNDSSQIFILKCVTSVLCSVPHTHGHRAWAKDCCRIAGELQTQSHSSCCTDPMTTRASIHRSCRKTVKNSEPWMMSLRIEKCCFYTAMLSDLMRIMWRDRTALVRNSISLGDILNLLKWSVSALHLSTFCKNKHFSSLDVVLYVTLKLLGWNFSELKLF